MAELDNSAIAEQYDATVEGLVADSEFSTWDVSTKAVRLALACYGGDGYHADAIPRSQRIKKLLEAFSRMTRA